MTRPKLLDLFCGAGGCAMGYHQAGFDVLGVDINPQPRFPFEFVQDDAIEFASRCGHEFDVIHASPPCQRYSTATPEGNRSKHPDLVEPTRQILEQLGKPFVIENVPGAPLSRGAIMFCGVMFGLRSYRHRYFECSHFVFVPPHEKHRRKCARMGSGNRAWWDAGGFVSIVGDRGTYCGPEGMGIDWMIGKELSQAIPPAFTKHIGLQYRRLF